MLKTKIFFSAWRESRPSYLCTAPYSKNMIVHVIIKFTLLDLHPHRMVESNQINRGSIVIGFIIKSMQDD